MSQDPHDELAGTEAPFVSHLIELRDRLVRALGSVLVAFFALALNLRSKAVKGSRSSRTRSKGCWRISIR